MEALVATEIARNEKPTTKNSPTSLGKSCMDEEGWQLVKFPTKGKFNRRFADKVNTNQKSPSQPHELPMGKRSQVSILTSISAEIPGKSHSSSLSNHSSVPKVFKNPNNKILKTD